MLIFSIVVIVFVAAGTWLTDGRTARHKRRINQKYQDKNTNKP